MLDEFLKNKWKENNQTVSLYMGVFYAVISFITSSVLFYRTPYFIGISTIMFIVIITIPSLAKLFAIEEKHEKENISFFKKHKSILSFFTYFFIAMFVVFFVISLARPELVFTSEHLYGKTNAEYNTFAGNSFTPVYIPFDSETLKEDLYEVLSVFENNVFVMTVCFLLSLFYGAGSVFLITINASVFASALAEAVKSRIPQLGYWFTYSYITCNIMVMFLHTIPELVGYYFGAVAGGILSRAFSRKKIIFKEIKPILKDAFTLFLIGILVLFLAAIIEMVFSKRLFSANVCSSYSYYATLLAGIFLVVLLVREYLKSKKVK